MGGGGGGEGGGRGRGRGEVGDPVCVCVCSRQVGSGLVMGNDGSQGWLADWTELDWTGLGFP